MNNSYLVTRSMYMSSFNLLSYLYVVLLYFFETDTSSFDTPPPNLGHP